MTTYTTAEVAAIIGIHPNTVRLYEKLNLIPKPERLSTVGRAGIFLNANGFCVISKGMWVCQQKHSKKNLRSVSRKIITVKYQFLRPWNFLKSCCAIGNINI